MVHYNVFLILKVGCERTQPFSRSYESLFQKLRSVLLDPQTPPKLWQIMALISSLGV